MTHIPTKIQGSPQVARSERVKLLYVIGTGRSGTTLISTILGHVPGFINVGELINLWDGLLGEIPIPTCACEKPYHECPVWSPILSSLLGDDDPSPSFLREMQALQAFVHKRKFDTLLPGRRGWVNSPNLVPYLDITDRLYRTVQQTTGARVIVDISKSIPYAHVLQQLSSVELYLLHVIRDPRGNLYSHQTRKTRNKRETTVPGMALYWSVLNGGTEWMKWIMRRQVHHYLRMRYEDFVNDPFKHVEQVARFLGEDQGVLSQLPFNGEHQFDLKETHVFAGNRIRFQKGTIEIKPDLEWTSRLVPTSKWVVTLLTLPLLLRYRYPMVINEHYLEHLSAASSHGWLP